jgi:polysaccharide chain length determinant protein (PEP-CTERM system associated)
MLTPDTPAGSSGFDFQDVLEIALRRWLWITIGGIGGLILGVILWWALPARFEATTTILVEPQGIPESYVRSTITVQVEQRIGTLRQRVTSHANLNELIDLLGSEHLDPSGDRSRADLMSEIRNNLTVEIDNPTLSAGAVVYVRYAGRDPRLVADVVREIANGFIRENHKDRVNQAAATASFLNAELTRIRTEVTAQEKRIREFRMAHMGGLPSQIETNLRELDRLDESLSSNLDAQERLAHEIGLLRSRPSNAAGPTSLGSALGRARDELIEARRVYTEDHPRVRSLRTQIAQLEAEIQAEPQNPQVEWQDPVLEREIEAATFNLKVRKGEERELRERIALLHARVEEAPKNEQMLLGLTRDYETLQQTYRLMLGNKHDADLSSNLEDAQMAEQFKLLRPPTVPSEPFWPDPMLIVPLGLCLGLGIVGLMILWTEIRTPAFHSVETLSRRLGLPIFATIPELSRKKLYDGMPEPVELDWRLVVPGAPNSAAAEQYRGFAPHFLEKESCRVILVTSAQPGDGKSVTCANLACTLASDIGRSVLLIDADMRRASQHRLMHSPREPGLTEVLKGEIDLSQCARNVLPNLSVLPAGGPTDNPLALLTDESFLKLCERAAENFEVVMIDSPPILPVIDAKILRRMSDMVIFVVRAGVSPTDGVLRSMRELKGVAGVVFNRVSPSAFRRYYYYDAYSHYDYK